MISRELKVHNEFYKCRSKCCDKGLCSKIIRSFSKQIEDFKDFSGHHLYFSIIDGRISHIEELIKLGVDLENPPEKIQLKPDYRKTHFIFTATLSGNLKVV